MVCVGVLRERSGDCWDTFVTFLEGRGKGVAKIINQNFDNRIIQRTLLEEWRRALLMGAVVGKLPL